MSFLWELQLLVVFVLFVAMIGSCQGYYNGASYNHRC